MKQFQLLMFVDDDNPSNVYHRIILEESELCLESKFFRKSLEGFDYLKSSIEDQDAIVPDVVFLDINMPYLDGWGFLKHLEELKLKSYPPIVMLSTSEYYKDIERSEAEPLVHSFLCKPLTKTHLEQLIQSLNNGA